MPNTRAQPQTCPLCLRTFFNKQAHLEECDGRPPSRCQRMVGRPGYFNTYVLCNRPFGHAGECEPYDYDREWPWGYQDDD